MSIVLMDQSSLHSLSSSMSFLAVLIVQDYPSWRWKFSFPFEHPLRVCVCVCYEGLLWYIVILWIKKAPDKVSNYRLSLSPSVSFCITVCLVSISCNQFPITLVFLAFSSCHSFNILLFSAYLYTKANFFQILTWFSTDRQMFHLAYNTAKPELDLCLIILYKLVIWEPLKRCDFTDSLTCCFLQLCFLQWKSMRDHPLAQ